ncbi:histidinol dehydrogenase [Ferruginibacter sp. HRS2-29]|uniref:histidinol dehydrogenase n=1 Tax=Ferruginibacter sp. HRS2-29 TaxID=2487334 RepID=UPI0020CF77D2|nr:histidinol dehydrogenase [Ferruginibacter sp. HRS2-29]MCP9749873.1 histidinol dehydrogenase [Ferruginibacter sp. HRS2-29]
MQIFISPPKNEWPSILRRPSIDNQSLENTVDTILRDVKLNGDRAVKKYSGLFDGVENENTLVSDAEFIEVVALVDDALKAAIDIAKKNITVFHQRQQAEPEIIETMPGVFCWRRNLAIEKVGLYIPGGSAPLFSTLLMLGIPARIAGCKEIVVCTPVDKNGKINPVILYVADLLGLKKVYKIGGVQAIAAMAYGTETVPQVSKIFGPGNQYVTCAKQLINKEGIAIDMPAGPSEVAVYADETAHPSFVAADLLSQAEHGADSQVLLVATSEDLVEAVKQAINLQLETLSRKEIAEKALQNSRLLVIKDTGEAFELLNEYAPEHLIIASDNAEKLAGSVVNAGSVFLGHYSPESVGDYASGTNHTLPTNSFAKAYSGVSLDSFVKKITFQKLTKQGLANIGDAVELMAAAEGLDAHKKAVSIRLNEISKK